MNFLKRTAEDAKDAERREIVKVRENENNF